MSFDYGFGKYINLFDLDDTLINSQHRCDFSSGDFSIQYWNDNNTMDKALKDHLIYQMYNIYKAFSIDKNAWNVVITSRELSSIDFQFFHNYGIKWDFWLHRDSDLLGDRYNDRLTMDSIEMKDLLLKNYKPAFPWKPGFAFDDKQEIVDVFNKHGFKSYNAWDINTCPNTYTNIINEALEMFKEPVV
jgi:hypothetical protein